MPIYEYRRPDGSTFEVLQSFSDEPLEHDPQTGVPVERVLHAPAVHFKGKGFYNTDYGTRKRQRETASSGDSGGSSGESGSSSAKSSGGSPDGGSSSGGSPAESSSSSSTTETKTSDAKSAKVAS